MGRAEVRSIADQRGPARARCGASWRPCEDVLPAIGGAALELVQLAGEGVVPGVLQRLSQHRNQKLRDLAECVSGTGGA